MLREQVAQLSQQLESTKNKLMTSRKESDFLQKQLAEQRFFANQKRNDFSPEITNKHNNNNNSNSETPSNMGTLTGRKVDAKHLNKPEPSNRTKNDDQSARSTSRSIAKCLRCNKLYNVMNQHNNTCHFHTGRKRQVEKYDGRGRLMCVTFVWQCCQRHADAAGCNVGKHI